MMRTSKNRIFFFDLHLEETTTKSLTEFRSFKRDILALL